MPKRVLVLGSSGLLGSAIQRMSDGVWADLDVFWSKRSHADLRERSQVGKLFEAARPNIVINCAAVVGGIGKNLTDPETLLLENLQMDSNVLEAALKFEVTNYLNFSSNCTYPIDANRPLRTEFLFQGPLEETNQGYAQAKLSAMLACQMISNKTGNAFRTLILSNMYGPGDNFSQNESHLVGAIVSKIISAVSEGSRNIEVWGTGKPLREFTYVEDVADFVVRNIRSLESFPLIMNLGGGKEHSVSQLHELALSILNLDLPLVFDPKRPDGVFSKMLDSSHAVRNFGWSPSTDMVEGMRKVFASVESSQSKRGKS